MVHLVRHVVRTSKPEHIRFKKRDSIWSGFDSLLLQSSSILLTVVGAYEILRRDLIPGITLIAPVVLRYSQGQHNQSTLLLLMIVTVWLLSNVFQWMSVVAG